MERLIKKPNIPIIYDFDDAIFHMYDQHTNKFLRLLLSNKLNPAITSANKIFAGNEYLAKYARQNSNEVITVPTVVDTTAFSPRITENKSSFIKKIGWIGTPSTWSTYLQPLIPVIEKLAIENNFKISVMGAKEHKHITPVVEFVPWSEETEIPFLQSLDVGIMPLFNSPWANGKCGYKLIQYMACGIPVIASPVGVNTQIVEHGKNGLLANHEHDWINSIGILKANPQLRQSMGKQGRKKIEENFSLQVWGPKVSKLILDTIKK